MELIVKGVLMDDLYQNSSFSQLDEPDLKEKTMDLFTNDHDYMEKVKELQGYLDMVQNIAKPGCSHEVLNVALVPCPLWSTSSPPCPPDQKPWPHFDNVSMIGEQSVT